MKHSQSGAVLIIVLIFLTVFAILNLYALESNIIESRMVRLLWEKESVCTNQQHSVRLLARNGKLLKENVCLQEN